MERFGKVTLSIHNLEPAVAMHQFTTTLRPGPFVNSICNKPPMDLDELRSQAAKYMQMKELTEYRNQVCIERRSNRREANKRETLKPQQENKVRRNEVERPFRGSKYPSYTILNTNRSRVLDQALATEILSMPRGHTTEECTALKDKIEDLIKEGHLRGFVQTSPTGYAERSRDRYPSPLRRCEDKQTQRQWSQLREPPARRYVEQEKYPKQVINTIAGGFAGGGPTNSARKRHLRQIHSINNISLGSRIQIPPITFNDNEFQGIDPVQDDPMVISFDDILNCTVRKMLIDQGSSADILYWNTFRQIGIPKDELREYHEPLVGFSGERVETRGCIDLYTSFGSKNKGKRIKVTYLVVHANTLYNILLGRPSLNKLKAIVSTSHLAMRFPSERGRIVTPEEDLEIDLDPRVDEGCRIEPNENKQPFQLGPKPEQVTYLGFDLSVQERQDFQKILQRNADLFAWSASDMPGIDPVFLCHHLSVYKEARPIAQKKRKIGGGRAKAMKEETGKLLRVNFIREVRYSTWLANVIMVKKANGKWRMCTDFTDHNKMYPPDEEKMTFIMDSANFCYRVMPFSLKNARATYQRLMNRIFERQVEKCMEVYVDDMARKHRIRFNLEKYTFGVASGKFLGFMLSERGIQANLDKCQAVIEMISPQNVKEVQRLASHIAALARFLPIMADRSRPFINLLRKSQKFTWTDECEAAFIQYKKILATPHVLTKRKPEKDMIIYLAVSDNAISSVLLQETPEPAPIYFISRTLQGPKSRYQLMEKVVLALVHTARQLRHYF
ncbi:uncharacterized protein LOC113857806 [Abrus precatorius]|uniref:Uncharacterized protein LOC113857806 n=1 Tax=Abrus precatorius TaxID=3816 RepID=A0A8B8KT93_ABRPR|nr:uncharacterized protein LOC113857806 [Abrus precatorius]